MTLYQHQQANIRSLITALGSHGAALDASDVGTGKTYTALGLCREIGAQPAIICPLATVPSWEDACRAMGVTPLFVANYEKLKTESFPYTKFQVERFENRDGTKSKRLKLEWVNLPTRVIFIFDEVQRCRSKSSEVSFILMETAKRYKTLLLSATPFTTPMEAFPIGRAIRLFATDKFYPWCLRHGARHSRFHNGLEFMGTHKDMEEIHSEIFPSRGVRTRRDEIPNFPQTLITADRIGTPDPTDVNRSYLDELALAETKDIERAREGVPEELWEHVTPLAITRNLRARQRAELLKVPVMAQLAQDALDKGFSVPVFLNFDASIMLFRQYHENCGFVTGNTQIYNGIGNRATHVKSFQKGLSRIIVVNAAAGGAGLNLHDPVSQVPRHSLISPPWSAITLRQVLGRSHRANGGFSRQQILFAADTVEERVMARVNERLNNLDALTDGDLDPLV